MAFPSSQGSNPQTLQRALENIIGHAGTLKMRSAGLRSSSELGNVDGAAIINYLRDVVQLRTRMSALASLPGLGAYAQEAYNNGSLNIVTEYNAMIAAVANVITWIGTNFPKDAGGFLIYEQIDGQGNVSFRSFTPAQTAGLRTQLDALLATID